MKTGLQNIVDLAVWCSKNPMDCNMFEKKCDLLTCRIKGKCLWSKDESEKVKNTKPVSKDGKTLERTL